MSCNIFKKNDEDNKPKYIHKIEEFKNIANYLSGAYKSNPNLNDEILLRTAINRYYYYIYLYLRDQIIELNAGEKEEAEVKKILIPEKGDNNKIGSHTFLIKYISHLVKTSRKYNPYDNRLPTDIKDYIGNLFECRKRADYTLNIKITNKDLDDARNYVIEIEKNINMLINLGIQLKEKNELHKIFQNIIK